MQPRSSTGRWRPSGPAPAAASGGHEPAAFGGGAARPYNTGMTGDSQRVDEWDEQRAPPPAAAPPIPLDAPPAGEPDAAPADGDPRPNPTWRQMARTTPAWVWALGC